MLFETRLEEERAQQSKNEEREQRQQLKSLDKLSHRNTPQDELSNRLHVVLNHFQHMDAPGKQKVVLGVIDSLHAHVTTDMLAAFTAHMSMYEKDKLLHHLFQDEIGHMTEYVPSQSSVLPSLIDLAGCVHAHSPPM